MYEDRNTRVSILHVDVRVITEGDRVDRHSSTAWQNTGRMSPSSVRRFLRKQRSIWVFPQDHPVSPDGTEHALFLYLGYHLTASAVYTLALFRPRILSGWLWRNQ